MPSVVSRVSEYAPGWLADYATVASALRDNYSALGPFEMSDVMIGITYLREEERRKRAEDLKSMVGKPPDADVLGRGPTPAELDDLRALCHATEAAYLEDRDKLAAELNEIKHQVVESEHTSKFQKPAHYVSQRVDTGDIFFVVRGTASLKDALTDGDCAPKPLDSKLPEIAGAHAHRGMKISAAWLVSQCLETLRMAVGNIVGMKKTPKITVLGHSLGAGAAAIAAVLLREHFPTLRCVAFATPPCLGDSACAACEKYLVSVVLHDDVIPRASFQNVEDLRVRLQNIDWKTMAAADFAESKTGRAMRAAGTAKEALERRTADAVKAGGDLTAKLLAKGRSLFGGGKANADASGKGSSGELAASAMDAAGKAGAAAAAAGKKAPPPPPRPRASSPESFRGSPPAPSARNPTSSTSLPRARRTPPTPPHPSVSSPAVLRRARLLLFSFLERSSISDEASKARVHPPRRSAATPRRSRAWSSPRRSSPITPCASTRRRSTRSR